MLFPVGDAWSPCGFLHIFWVESPCRSVYHSGYSRCLLLHCVLVLWLVDIESSSLALFFLTGPFKLHKLQMYWSTVARPRKRSTLTRITGEDARANQNAVRMTPLPIGRPHLIVAEEREFAQQLSLLLEQGWSDWLSLKFWSFSQGLHGILD